MQTFWLRFLTDVKCLANGCVIFFSHKCNVVHAGGRVSVTVLLQMTSMCATLDSLAFVVLHMHSLHILLQKYIVIQHFVLDSSCLVFAKHIGASGTLTGTMLQHSDW